MDLLTDMRMCGERAVMPLRVMLQDQRALVQDDDAVGAPMSARNCRNVHRLAIRHRDGEVSDILRRRLELAHAVRIVHDIRARDDFAYMVEGPAD
jgi:hypothetical protein